MKCYLVLAVVILRTNFLKVEGNCNAGNGKTTCITEDLLHMLMNKPGSSTNKCECKDHNKRPAFTAIIKTNIKVNSKYVFKFDKVEVNHGNNYNSNTGMFTAPRNGLYHFSCTIVVNTGGNAAFNLMKNNDIYLLGYVVTALNDSQTLSIVMDLEKEDHVYVKSGSSYGVQGRYSYFSGYLL